MDIRNLRKILREFEKSTIHKLEISEKDFTIKMEKKDDHQKAVVLERPTEKIERVDQAKEEEKQDYQVVQSPLVGTYYQSPSPESAPFVSLGQRVKEGDILCIVEAMKVMNEIRSSYTGIIRKIHLKNDDMVEYGQPLFEIEAL